MTSIAAHAKLARGEIMRGEEWIMRTTAFVWLALLVLAGLFAGYRVLATSDGDAIEESVEADAGSSTGRDARRPPGAVAVTPARRPPVSGEEPLELVVRSRLPEIAPLREFSWSVGEEPEVGRRVEGDRVAFEPDEEVEVRKGPLRISAPGFASRVVNARSLIDPTYRITVVLDPQAEIVLEIEAGRARGTLEVYLWSLRDGFDGTTPTAAFGMAGPTEMVEGRSVWVGAEGRATASFRVAPGRGMTCTVSSQFRTVGSLVAVPAPLEIEALAHSERRVVRWRPFGEAGRVVRLRGRPTPDLAGRTVALAAERDHRWAQTDDRGEIWVEARPEGSFRLSYRPSAYGYDALPLRLEDGGEEFEFGGSGPIDAHLPESMIRLHLREEETGDPITSFSISTEVHSGEIEQPGGIALLPARFLEASAYWLNRAGISERVAREEIRHVAGDDYELRRLRARAVVVRAAAIGRDERPRFDAALVTAGEDATYDSWRPGEVDAATGELIWSFASAPPAPVEVLLRLPLKEIQAVLRRQQFRGLPSAEDGIFRVPCALAEVGDGRRASITAPTVTMNRVVFAGAEMFGADRKIEGRLDGRPFHGQRRGEAFVFNWNPRGEVSLFGGEPFRLSPDNTTLDDLGVARVDLGRVAGLSVVEIDFVAEATEIVSVALFTAPPGLSELPRHQGWNEIRGSRMVLPSASRDGDGLLLVRVHTSRGTAIFPAPPGLHARSRVIDLADFGSFVPLPDPEDGATFEIETTFDHDGRTCRDRRPPRKGTSDYWTPKDGKAVVTPKRS
ncbi:MAG: hypothetical protein R3F20_01515 [Planctomycetota bacterium]